MDADCYSSEIKLFLGGEKEDHRLLLVEAHTPIHKKEWELVDLKYFKPKYSYMASYKQPFFFFSGQLEIRGIHSNLKTCE